MARTLLAAGLAASTFSVPGWALHMSQQKMSPLDTVEKAAVEGSDMIPLWPTGNVPLPLPSAEDYHKAYTAQQFIDTNMCKTNASFPGNLYLVQEPSMKPYVLKGTSGPTLVVFPGGGHNFLSWVREGAKVAEWLNSVGINAFVVKYRIPSDQGHEQIDAQRAMSLVRHKAKEFGLDPAAPIGAAGFSAGGGIVIDLATHTSRQYAPIGAADDETFRPDFVLHIYGVSGLPDATGKYRAGKDLPPVFSISAVDDPCVPAVGATAQCDTLKAMGGTCERHVYENGGHGYGVCNVYTNKWSGEAVCQWKEDAIAWMQKQGYLKTTAVVEAGSQSQGRHHRHRHEKAV